MPDPSFVPHPPLSLSPITLGSLEALVVSDVSQLRAAQKLRHEVFYNELGARKPDDVGGAPPEAIDQDEYDHYCDHLIVVDHAKGGEVVATYRLLRREQAEKVGRFYTSNEYDISSILMFPGKILELGRSCVAADYRTQPTMKLLWRGLGAYLNFHTIDLMFGCASLRGTSIDALKDELSYLYHYHLAPPDICPKTLPDYYVSMDIVPKEALQPKRILCHLPPLLKAYLRVGGFVGKGAFVDHDFNTTDVCIVVKTNLIQDKYLKQYF